MTGSEQEETPPQQRETQRGEIHHPAEKQTPAIITAAVATRPSRGQQSDAQRFYSLLFHDFLMIKDSFLTTYVWKYEE